MQVAQLFVGTNGVHVSVDAIARFDAVFAQYQAFPFGQRMHDFGFLIAHIFDGETNRLFFSR